MNTLFQLRSAVRIPIFWLLALVLLACGVAALSYGFYHSQLLTREIWLSGGWQRFKTFAAISTVGPVLVLAISRRYWPVVTAASIGLVFVLNVWIRICRSRCVLDALMLLPRPSSPGQVRAAVAITVGGCNSKHPDWIRSFGWCAEYHNALPSQSACVLCRPVGFADPGLWQTTAGLVKAAGGRTWAAPCASASRRARLIGSLHRCHAHCICRSTGSILGRPGDAPADLLDSL